MSEPFLGEVRLFGFTYAPRGWAFCRGQILSIPQNQALFALIGVSYGGDGRSTFALPNLQGNIPVGQGQAPGLSSYNLGQTAGSATVTLLQNNLPPHTHTLIAGAGASTATPTPGAYLGSGSRGTHIFATTTNTTMNPLMVTAAGNSQPHNNLMPYLALNYCICLQGIFPSRN